MTSMKLLRATVFAAALSVPLAATSAQAQAPVVIGGGLVNVQIGTIDVSTGDILSQNDVQVSVNAAAQIAANVCGVAVNVLATEIANNVPISCQTTGDLVARFVNIN